MTFCTEVGGVSSESVAPGDVIVIPPTGLSMPCDAALLTGHAIVNEAMLTGGCVSVGVGVGVCVVCGGVYVGVSVGGCGGGCGCVR